MRDYYTNSEDDAGKFERMLNDEPPERPSPDEYADQPQRPSVVMWRCTTCNAVVEDPIAHVNSKPGHVGYDRI